MTPGEDKRLVAVAEKGPNCLFHLMAVARAGFDSEYADRYREAVARADLSFLEASRGRLSFQDGRTGDLANLAIFLPAYLSHETGTHLLIDMIRELMGSSPGADFDVVYRAYENLARFYNTLVLGASDIYEMPERYHGKEFDRIYRSLYAENSNRSPEEMLRLGIAEFSGVGREE